MQIPNINGYLLIFMKSHKLVEMKKILGRLLIKKYCRPPWLADEENFSS